LSRENGQALAELALIAPLFVLLLWISLQVVTLFSRQLDLISLAREMALGRGRMTGNTAQNTADLARRLCQLKPRLDPGRLEISLESAGAFTSATSMIGSLGTFIPGLGKNLGPMRIGLRYRCNLPGPGRWLFPQGVPLEEKIVCKSDFWKVP
jgi:hypothetical protein